ncbi:MAG: TonB-dependent receptor [bacterium]
MKRYFLALALLVTLLFPLVAEAGLYGVLKGKVTDADTGEGLIGATVFVIGTSIGTNVTNKDGSYTLTNIPSGTYQVKFSYVGMKSIEKSVRISADNQSNLDAALKAEYAKGEQIDVVAEKLVRKGDIGTGTNMGSEKISVVSRTDLAGVVTLSAGIQSNGTGFEVRGSRAEDTQIRVDGMDIGNQFTGGLGSAGVAYAPVVSQYATEEVQSLRGGFSAEYGEALGGVINNIVKTGRLDRYEGFLVWSTDVQALYGKQPFGVTLQKQGTKYIPVTGGEGAQLLSQKSNAFEFGTGGPIPFLKNSTFYISGLYKTEEYPSSGYERYDPAGNNIARLSDQGSWVKNITGRLTFGITKSMKLSLGGTWGLTNYQNSDLGWYYCNDAGNIESSAGVPERIAKQAVWNITIANIYARLNHTIDNTQFYEITFGRSTNNDERSRRASGEWGDPDFFNGFALMLPQDQMKLNGNGTGLVAGSDRLIDQYTSLTETRTSNDGYIVSNYPAKNPLTGYYEGASNASGTTNPWGMQWFTPTHGNAGGFQFRNGYYWELDGNYTKSLESGDFSHYIKAGVNGRLLEMHRHMNAMPWDGNAFRDIYTNQWGGNIYADGITKDIVNERTSKPYYPVKASGYFQDQIEYKGIILSGGLRFDYFMPNSLYRLPRTDGVFTSISDSASRFGTATNKFQISPRLNVAYPITEESVLRISYGLYFQMPMLNYMYDGFGIDVLRAGNILGNPNLEAQRTNNYEVRLDQQIAEGVSVGASVYYKDIYNQLGVAYVPTVPSPYFEYNVNEYGSNRGLELEISKAPMGSDHFGLDINYSLAWLEGTSDGSNSNANAIIDPYSGKQAFPLATYPLSRDVRNRLKGSVYFIWGDNDGPAIGGIQPLENASISMTGTYRSGIPYTKSDKNGNPLGETNAERFPSAWGVDMRLSKSFYLRDWFGDGFKNTQIEFYLDIYNVLNRRVVMYYYTATGDPIDDGASLERTIGSFADVSFFKTADFSNAASYSTSQYDNYGNRLYSEAADYNRDGIVTREEIYESYLKYIELSMSGLGNYQGPRSAYGGIKIVF